MKISHILWGGAIAYTHSFMLFPLSIFFGLGMSPSGAWFLNNIYAQPGTSIEQYLLTTGLISPNYKFYIFLLSNIIFYWILSSSLIYFISRHKNKKVSNEIQ